MTSCERFIFLLILAQSGVYESAVVKRDNNEGVIIGSSVGDSPVQKNLFGRIEERDLEQEIVQELNHLSERKQREIFTDLEKQQQKFNVSNKTLLFSEPGNLSPVEEHNVEELKNIRKTIKASNSSLPPIRNKRTLNFLLQAVARAMGYTLTPTNPDAEWIPRQQPPPSQPCATPPPPCTPNPPSTPPPCATPPPTPPCTASAAFFQAPTIPPDQINPNTISYPYRPARTIPLFNFAPLPAGIRVPYPPLLQPPAQQRSSCPPQQPSPPCGAPPPSSPAPCMPTPAPGTPPPCRPPTPPPCGPAQPPPPCGATPAPPPSPCRSTPAPPCAATPAPSPPPCPATAAPPPPPCSATPAPPPPPCAATPKPPPCATPPPPPCGNPPPPPPSDTPKKGSILLEYDDPVRIQIFSNDKKYLPASGNIFSGHDNDEKEDWDGYFPPEKNKQKEENYEEKEEMEEEHIEEEEEDESPGQLKHYEEEDEKSLVNEEEDESETSLSVVKKPAEDDVKKVNSRRLVSSKWKTSLSSDSGKSGKEDNAKQDKGEKSVKMKAPKRKKWVRIVKKQRKKTKTDSGPRNSLKVHSSDSFPDGSDVAPFFYGKRDPHSGFDSFEEDVSDYSDDSSSHSSEDSRQIDVKKVIVDNKELQLAAGNVEDRGYEFNINPYALEPEEERRKKLEKAVERYVEDYVEKQLGDEIVKNTGVPKTTVFEFSPKNGPKIQTITTTVAKTSHTGSPANFKPQIRPETPSRYKLPNRNAHILRKNSYEENFNKRGDASFEAFATHI